jgi:hypothetical protein
MKYIKYQAFIADSWRYGKSKIIAHGDADRETLRSLICLAYSNIAENKGLLYKKEISQREMMHKEENNSIFNEYVFSITTEELQNNKDYGTSDRVILRKANFFERIFK